MKISEIKNEVRNTSNKKVAERIEYLNNKTQYEFYGFKKRIPLTKKQIRRQLILFVIDLFNIKLETYTIQLKSGRRGVRSRSI